MKELAGNIVDVIRRKVYPGIIRTQVGLIQSIERTDKAVELTAGGTEGMNGPFLLPGFVDGHIHIESSMLTPSRFAETVLPYGTTGVVADPHEIANVMGLEGMAYMREDAGRTPLRFHWTVPSCVPATNFETSRGRIGSDDIKKLLESDAYVALGEMMNYPGVLNKDPEVMAKIEAARDLGKPIDGHAPLLTGEDLGVYISAGISTDHECSRITEAMEKAKLGMTIQVRQGSAAKNLSSLIDIYSSFDVMTVSDDRHPGDLMKGHLDSHLRDLVEQGADLASALRSVTIVPCEHYGINAGALEPGRLADIVAVRDLQSFRVMESYIGGEQVYGRNINWNSDPLPLDHQCRTHDISPEMLVIGSRKNEEKESRVRVIEVQDGELITEKYIARAKVKNGEILADTDNDILYLSVVDRHEGKNIGMGFVKGFGFRNGALSSTIAHDSHNIICVGTDRKTMYQAINMIKENGGICVRNNSETLHNGASKISSIYLPLPVAGLMSTRPCREVTSNLNGIRSQLGKMGCCLASPIITLSFLALLVIPKLKLSDRGLFDVESFKFVDVEL